ncbi:MAG: hypothetical protein JNJ71_04765 [Rubrivivax sp.]|nr:hypothetical protein [Rubrivivax sp.]
MSADDTPDELAQEAARLVVDEGLEYGPAKAKAARSLGLRRARWPNNESVEDAVREHLALFCGETQPQELAALREVALQWMQRLAAFHPHLAGAVWRGTATRLSAVLIDLYCDDPKMAPIELLNLGIAVDFDAAPDGSDEPVPVLSVSSRSAALGETVPVHLFVRDRDDLRGALKPDARGHSWRGDREALLRRMAQELPT